VKRKKTISNSSSGGGGGVSGALSKLDTLLESGISRSNEEGEKALAAGDATKSNNGAAEDNSTVGNSTFYIRQQQLERSIEERKTQELITKNAVYATIVFGEFVKELAAVAQEHAVSIHHQQQKQQQQQQLTAN